VTAILDVAVAFEAVCEHGAVRTDRNSVVNLFFITGCNYAAVFTAHHALPPPI
jgi:hypothetical protein